MKVSDIKPGMLFQTLHDKSWISDRNCGVVTQRSLPKGFIDVIIDIRPMSGGVELMLTKGFVYVADFKLGVDVSIFRKESFSEELERLGGDSLLKEFIELVLKIQN